LNLYNSSVLTVFQGVESVYALKNAI